MCTRLRAGTYVSEHTDRYVRTTCMREVTNATPKKQARTVQYLITLPKHSPMYAHTHIPRATQVSHIHTDTLHMHTHAHTHTHTHHTPGHVFTVGMDVHLKPLVVVELLPDGCLVLWPEHGPRLGRSSVIFLCIHHLSIVRKGPDGKREFSRNWA